MHLKNKIFPLVSTGNTSDDKGLRADSPTSSFSTTDKFDKSDESNEFDFTADDLDKCILVMLMILINSFLIQRNI